MRTTNIVGFIGLAILFSPNAMAGSVNVVDAFSIANEPQQND
jgi:hypothetical protein